MVNSTFFWQFRPATLMIIMRRYQQLLRIPHVKILLISAFPARIAYGMIALAVFFKAQQATGSIAIAGLAIGLETFSSAITAGLRGSLMDRWGQKWPLRIFVPAYALMILALNASHSQSLLLGISFLLGLTAPPINLSIRPLWKTVVPAQYLRTAYALDTAVISAATVIGPVMATTLALSSHPGSALGLCSGLLFLGGVSLAVTKVSSTWQPEIKERGRASLFNNPAFRLLMLEGCFIGFGMGAFDIGVPAFSTLEHLPHRTAWILGVMGMCNIFGGLLGGLVSKRTPPLLAFRRTYLIWFILTLPLALTYPGWSLALVGGFLGLCGGAQQVFYLEVMEAVRPRGSAISALGWLWTVEGTLMSFGAAVGGLVSNSISPRVCLSITTICVGSGLLVLTIGKGRLSAANAIPTEEQDLNAMKDNASPAQ
jgi:MFS family permease